MGKDTVYRFLKSGKIDWTSFLTHIASRIANTSIIPLTNEQRKNVFIIDDSLYERGRSKKVELMSRVFDHAKRAYCLAWLSYAHIGMVRWEYVPPGQLQPIEYEKPQESVGRQK